MTGPHNIVHNRARCNGCRDELESKWQGEPVTCSCGALTIDGGRSYLSRSVKIEQADYTELSEHEPSSMTRGFLG